MKDYKIVRTYLYNKPYYIAYKRHYLFFWKKYREFGEEEFHSMKRTLMKFINMDIEDCYIIKTKHCK